MTVELDIPLKARLKEGKQHPQLNPDEWYNVEYISMGQSYTSIELANGVYINSIFLDFYIQELLINFLYIF